MGSYGNGDSKGELPTDKQDPIFTPRRKVRIVCIGAGASGLYLAYKMQRHFDDFSLQVIEKNRDVGGTWFENRYPGCACDVPAQVYTYSFEPKVDWSRYFAGSKEIQGYFRTFAEKHDLLKYIQFGQEVVGANWDDASTEWTVTYTDRERGTTRTTTCDCLINSGGVLNSWRWPDIPGLQNFEGPKVHSADWDDNIQLQNKTIGLIGNGSSGIQILPAILPEVSQITSFIRAPTWVASPMGTDNPEYTNDQVGSFVKDPQSHIDLRKGIEGFMNSTYPFLLQGTDAHKQMRDYMEEQMKKRIVDTELRERLVPTWSPGCRRVTAGPAYLEALDDPKVSVQRGAIDEVTPTGLIMDGKSYDFDVLICATGFDTSFKPRFPVEGPSSTLAEVWKENPRAYFGLAAPEMPNYFMTLGPNSPVGTGAVIPVIESQVDYVVAMISKFQKENIKSFTLRPEVTDELLQVVDDFMPKTVWTEDCRSWYKAGTTTGRVTALWPGSILHYMEAVKNPRWEDWKFQYSENRFKYLGNFQSSAERRGGDLAWYIRSEDNSTIDPCLKEVKTVREVKTVK